MSSQSPDGVLAPMMVLENSNSHFSSIEESSSTRFFSASLHKNEDRGDDTASDEDNKYAFKKLKDNLQGETKISGVIDLTIEAQFLSRLSHPSIVKLRGTGGEPGSKGVFHHCGSSTTQLYPMPSKPSKDKGKHD